MSFCALNSCWAIPKNLRLLGAALLLIPAPGCLVTTHAGPGHSPAVATEEEPLDSKPTATPGRVEPESISASHVLVQYQGAERASATITRSKEEARKRAEEALARARAGEPFAELVKEYSDEPGAAERGGNLGSFTRDVMVDEFADAAFRLEVGQISDVVESPFGFHIILREE